MIINRNGYDFLRLLLAYHVLIQARFDLMRRRYITNIENGIRFLLFFLFFFLFNFLFVGNSIVSLQVSQVHKADIGIFSIFIHIVQHIHQLRIIQHPLIIILAYGIHRPVHTIITDTDVIGKMVHLPRLAFRTAADEAHILVFLFLFLLIRSVLILNFFQSLFLLVVFFSIIKIAHLAILRFSVQPCRPVHHGTAGSRCRLLNTYLIINHNLLPHKLTFYKQTKLNNMSYSFPLPCAPCLLPFGLPAAKSDTQKGRNRYLEIPLPARISLQLLPY